MLYRILADLTLLAHLAFVLFVVLGALLLFRWPRLVWVHAPMAMWGVLIELIGWTCPLTPLENYFRRLGGEAGYRGGFVEHYLLSLIYPGGYTRQVGVVLGLLVLGINAVLYALAWRRARRAHGA
jgi:hypothetical protein